MKKAVWILVSCALMISGASFAAEPPSAGKTVLRLSDDNAVREARKALTAIDKEIARVNQEIVNSQNSAATYKALPNNGLRSSQADAQTVALQIQRDELLSQREGLRAAIVKSAE